MHLLSLARAYIQPRTSFRKSQKVKKSAIPSATREAAPRAALRWAHSLSPAQWACSGLLLNAQRWAFNSTAHFEDAIITREPRSGRVNDGQPPRLFANRAETLAAGRYSSTDRRTLRSDGMNSLFVSSFFSVFLFLSLLFLSCFSCSFLFFFFFSFFFFSTCVSRRDRRPHGSKKI